mgnify:CR=1 FL=1|jgi:hypothetical protein
MTRDLHEAILQASDLVAQTEHTHREVAEAMGLDPRTHRRWRKRDLKPEQDYQGHKRDQDRLCSLQDWIDTAHSKEEPGQGYSGPADAERDPHAVTAEEIKDYGVGGYGAPVTPEVNGATAETSFDPQKAIKEQDRRFKQKHRRAEKKRSQTIRFDTGPVMLAFLGDQHIGNAGTNIRRVFEEQQTIKRTPGAYAWIMGDVVDNFIVGRLQEQNMKPAAPIWEQWQLAKEYLERWEDRIVAYVGGNHGAWTMSQTQIDYRRDICPDGVLYDGDDVQADVSVGSATYSVWARHKWRGNSIYNQTHGQERAARFNDPNHDIYVGAHTHEGALYREMIHEGQRKAAVQIGTYKVHDDYARAQGFPESDMSTACAVILHDDGSMHGMADLTAAKRYMQALY